LSPVDPEAAVDAPKLVKAFETPTKSFHRPATAFSTSLTMLLRLDAAVVATGAAALVVVGTTGAGAAVVVGTGATVDVC